MIIDFTKEVTIDDLKTDFRSDSDYDSMSQEFFEEANFFERRLSVAPFYASGATLVLASTAMMSFDGRDEITASIIPMIWMLIASIGLQFFGGVFYVLHSSNLRSHFKVRGNAQRLFNNYKDKLTLVSLENDKATQKHHSSKAKEVLAETNRLIRISQAYDESGWAHLRKARILIVLGFVIFLLSILSPLMVISANKDFGFF